VFAAGKHLWNQYLGDDADSSLNAARKRGIQFDAVSRDSNNFFADIIELEWCVGNCMCGRKKTVRI
jgi:hypothetical protein